MSTMTLRQMPASAMVMAASLVAMCMVILGWSAYLRTGADVSSITSWSDVSWQIAQVDSRGRLVRLGSHPLALASLLSLVTLCSIGFALGAYHLLTGKDRNDKQIKAMTTRLEKAGRQLDNEVFSVLSLIKTHVELNGSRSESLAKVNKSLPTLTSPEQIRAVVQVLINENSKVQHEVSTLNARLAQSQTQIQKLRESLSESQRLGMMDALTSLKNRHWLVANLAREVEVAADSKAPLSAIMADIDHFKQINDTFGHAVGDEILRRFGELLSKNIKGRDTAVRYGGEEFLVLLPHTKAQGAKNLSEQLRSELESKKWKHHKTGQPIGKVTASFGVAELREGEKGEALIERADEKLYEAKSQGRNRVICET